MAQYVTRKATTQGKAQTLARRNARAAKMGALVNRSGHTVTRKAA